MSVSLHGQAATVRNATGQSGDDDWRVYETWIILPRKAQSPGKWDVTTLVHKTW